MEQEHQKRSTGQLKTVSKSNEGKYLEDRREAGFKSTIQRMNNGIPLLNLTRPTDPIFRRAAYLEEAFQNLYPSAKPGTARKKLLEISHLIHIAKDTKNTEETREEAINKAIFLFEPVIKKLDKHAQIGIGQMIKNAKN